MFVGGGGVVSPAGNDPSMVVRLEDVQEGAGRLESAVGAALGDHLGGALQPGAVVPPLDGGGGPAGPGGAGQGHVLAGLGGGGADGQVDVPGRELDVEDARDDEGSGVAGQGRVRGLTPDVGAVLSLKYWIPCNFL